MTRIYTDGAEMRDTLFWTYVTANTTVTNVNPVPAFSSYYYKINADYVYRIISAIDECYVRARIYVSDARTLSTNWMLPAFYNGSNMMVGLSLDDMGHLFVQDSAWNTLDTGTAVLLANQWYLIEMHVKIADAPNGIFQVYVDAVLDIDFTGDTKTTAFTTFDVIKYRAALTIGGGFTLGVDDLALNDTAGGTDDGYCGEGVIAKQTPAGNGAHNNWHGSDLDDVDNYLMVDEYPHDADTTYVYHDGSASGTQDQYTVSDYDGTGKTIRRIYPEARIRKTAAAAHTVKLGTLASGGADAMSAAMNLGTAYARYVGNEQTVNPVDSAAWEEADIDALQLIVEVG